ncbi:hypothetical protein ACNRBS_10530 [Ralstonia pseudosolanacearum]|uniref:Uncharacterized protein n=2 Tax=Ralstonia syzygii TaxID=28097 RepID=A0ABX7ZDQ8_9RALS|nr:hypothetical protein [Ralstonia pseudosolanacearum]QUP53548.1 hypothetical protein GO998_07095 [Ralstonia syzygii]BCL91934.1 hypothetical protein MAFF211479_16350 [Ralstonia solanacearum]BCL97766.1 hypothetical protein MAFF211491_22180 [Ralstonia solanacearum]BCM13208.1 hypothetical protein MAFF241648_23980 [Ralstonia solanacearum]BCN04498.1 hypothetical protein RPSB_16350 [Ralstonia solanacearum]
MAPGKKLLRRVNSGAYTFFVAETTVTGFGDSINTGGQPPLGGIFSSVTPLRAYFHGGPGGETFGSAGSCVPVRQPRRLARHPSFGDERRASTNTGGHHA